MTKHLVAAVAATALALAACGNDDDDRSTDASAPASAPTCEAFSLEDAEALLGRELHDQTSPESSETFCFYDDDTGTGSYADVSYVQWGAIVDPAGADYESTRRSIEDDEPFDGIGDDAFFSETEGIHVHVDGVSMVAYVFDDPGDGQPRFDRDATLTVLRAIVEAVEAQE